ncbi:MAG: NHL repeat-containing protein, partial [Actinomycetota bacterium]
MAHDPVGSRVIVADTGNDRLVTLDPATGARTGQLSMGAGSLEGQIDQPMGVVAAPDGSIWVSDTGNNRVQKFNPDGSFAGEVIGGGPAGAGNDQLNFPMQLTFGPDGLLYVADMYNNRIQVFQVAPEPFNPRYQSEIFDPGGIAPLYPAGGAADVAGNSYVADTGNERIVRIAPDGSQTTVASEGLNHPRGLANDSDPGLLWVADTTDNQILQMTTEGVVVKTFGGGTGYVNAPMALAADASGVFIADTYNNRAKKVSKADGAALWTTTSCSSLALKRPRGITVGSDGSIYVTDTVNHRVLVLDPATGACLRVLGSVGGGPGQFRQPVGLVSDGAGGFWAADAGNFRVQHLRNDGTFIAQTTTGGGDGPGQFRQPMGIWTFPGGAIAVSDTNAWRIHVFDVDAAGAPVFSHTLGGVPPAPGGFNQPYGAAYGPAGELYVVDMFNHRVQKFNPDGAFALQWGSFGGHDGGFQFPRGIAVSPDGQMVVVTDSENSRIAVFSAAGAFVRTVKPTG